MKQKIQSPNYLLMMTLPVINFLDYLRVATLKKTMMIPVFRDVFTNRSKRLFFFFLASVSFNILIALKAPLWILLFGPLVFGVPHLISSIRYVPKLADLSPKFLSKKLYVSIGSFFILIGVVRLWAMSLNPDILSDLPNGLELLGCIFAFILIGILSKQDIKKILVAATFLTILCIISFRYPLEALGGLILIHNFVGFFFWIQRAPKKRDKETAIASLIIFTGITLLIILGAFDSLMESRATGILGGVLNDLSIGSMIFPNASFTLWSRAVSAYAFGQGVHYFVWLKAVPEQELPFEHPVSFSKSAQLLTTDLGNKCVLAAGLFALGLIVFGVISSFPEARLFYLGGAAFHGYFEIAGLAFVKTKQS